MGTQSNNFQDEEPLHLAQLEGAILTYEDADGNEVTVDFDSEANSEEEVDEENPESIRSKVASKEPFY